MGTGGFREYTTRSARVQGCSGEKIYGISASVADGKAGEVLNESEGTPDYA